MGRLTFSYSGVFKNYYSHGFKLAGLPFLLLLWINQSRFSGLHLAWGHRYSLSTQPFWLSALLVCAPFLAPPPGVPHFMLETERILSQVMAPLAMLGPLHCICETRLDLCKVVALGWFKLEKHKAEYQNMSDISFHSCCILKPASLSSHTTLSLENASFPLLGVLGASLLLVIWLHSAMAWEGGLAVKLL